MKPMNQFRLYKSYGYKNKKLLFSGENALDVRLGKQKRTAKLYTTKMKDGSPKSDYTVREFSAYRIQTARNYCYEIKSSYAVDNTLLESMHAKVTSDIVT